MKCLNDAFKRQSVKMNDTEIAENSKGQGSSLERMTQTR